MTQSIKPDGIKVDSNGNGEGCSTSLAHSLLFACNFKLVLSRRLPACQYMLRAELACDPPSLVLSILSILSIQ